MEENHLYVSISGKIIKFIDDSQVTFSVFNKGQEIYSRAINPADFSRNELHEIINATLNNFHEDFDEQSRLQTVKAYNKIKRS